MQATKEAKPKRKEMTSSLKSTQEKKSQKDADKQKKDVNKKKEAEQKAKEAHEKKYKDVQVDYKDPYQLSEGEIMIVIEHSDDPGRVLMSTSHDYDKYKRIASKIRQWIMRDFPSMKVMIKPNNHQKDNKRIGCFEIVYFHKHEGELERHDIFSKMVERKWPKWKAVQEKIKNYVKNSNLQVTLHDGSKEKKNLFEGMVIHVKNVLFAKSSPNSGATTKSLAGSSMGQSTMMGSQMSGSGEPSLTPFLSKTSDASGVVKFEHLPVGNYMIVFDGNRTYRPMKLPFSVEAQTPEIKKTFEVQLEEEGFFSMEVDTFPIYSKKNKIKEDISTAQAKTKKDELEKEKKTIETHEKQISHYQICLLPSDPNRNENTPCIPIKCETSASKNTLDGHANILYEAVIEPGKYDIMLINGSENKVLKKDVNLTRGENRFVLEAGKNNEIIDDAVHKKKLKEEKSARDAAAAKETADMRKDNASTKPAENVKPADTKPAGQAGQTGAAVSGTANTDGKTGVKTGKQRPDTTSSLVSEGDESYNRLGSADIKNRPGSASHNKVEDHKTHITAAPARVITEDPHENDDEKFMVKMFVEQGELPFEMQFIYEDEDEVVGIYSPHSGPRDHGVFTAEANKSVFSLDDVRQREGYYRMIILRKVDVKSFQPVHVMINSNGSTIVKKISRDPFVAGAEAENQCLDYAVFKFPDNVYMPIGVVINEYVKQPRYMLSQIRSLISKLSESKLGIDKIFGRIDSDEGFGGKTEKHEGEECLNVKEVKKSLENFMIPISDHILGAFKLHPEKDLISLKKLTEVVDSWRQNVSVLDEIDEEYEEGEDDGNGEDEFDAYDASDNDA